MSKPIRKIRLFVIEDDDLTRTMIKSLLMKVRQFHVVGEANNGEAGVAAVSLISPNVVIADIGLPGIDGIEAVRRIRQANPDIRSIMLTAHGSDDDLFQSIRAGAEGYILKTGLSGKRLELAIKSVDCGSVWLDPLIADRVLRAAITYGAQSAARAALVPPLSAGETAVLEKVAGSTLECDYGVCQVDPAFLYRLKRFSNADYYAGRAIIDPKGPDGLCSSGLRH